MKLLNRLLLRIAGALTLLLAVWAVLFYYAMMGEIDDEMDDSLETRAEQLMMRSLAGQPMPVGGWDANNTYLLKEVAAEYASAHPSILFQDREFYIPERGHEPARVLTTFFRDGGGRWFELVVMTPSIEKEDLREAVWQWVVALYGCLLLTILVISGWLIWRTMRPLYALVRWLDGSRMGDRTSPPEVGAGVVEFRILNDAVRRNAKRAEELFEQQKQFIGNASHEMQTPLSVCRNRLEMLADDTSLSESQLEQLARVDRTLDYMVRLNKTLLLLSKIENGQFPEVETIELGALTEKLADDYREIYASQGLQIEVDVTGVFEMSMNPTLASVLVANLLKNACVHNVAPGEVQIEVTAQRLCIRNQGQEGSLDVTRIFERFYQGTKNEGSTGLGLGLASAICRLYGMSLVYEWREKMHCFTVRR